MQYTATSILANQAVPGLSPWPRGLKVQTAKVNIIKLAVSKHVGALKVLSESSALELVRTVVLSQGQKLRGTIYQFYR